MTGISLNKTIHEQSRLKILVFLASDKKRTHVPFTDIQQSLSFSSGNLSVQLKTLEEAGYITIQKRFEDNKPLTEVQITDQGRHALVLYISEMEKLLSNIKTAQAAYE